MRNDGRVIFCDSDHTYLIGERQLLSVTQLMRKHGLAPDYSAVDKKILEYNAERGKLIHAEIEAYIKSGEIGFTKELNDFIELCEENGIFALGSEVLVYDEEYGIAGTIDIMGFDADGTVLADIKTTSALHKSALSWQLSIYEYLAGEKFNKLTAFHLVEGGGKLVDVERVPQQEVKRLLDCEKNGMTYAPLIPLSKTEIAELAEVENLVAEIENKLTAAKNQRDEMRKGLIAAMKKAGVKTFDTERMKITYVAEGKRETLDTKLIEANYPDIAKACKKVSKTAASVRVTLK